MMGKGHRYDRFDGRRPEQEDQCRSGAECKAPGGALVPIVNRGKCEAKGDCVEVCPYDVFEVRPIGENDYRALGWLGRLRMHGMRTAYTPNAHRCLACGLCVVACPEKSIRLVEITPQAG